MNLFKNNKIKVTKIKSATPQKVGKVILWILICFLILRGVGSILRKDQSKAIEAKVESRISALENKNKVTEEASAFAASFIKEYLTYKKGDTEGYRKRIGKYLPQTLLGQTTSIITESDVQAMDIMPISIKFYTSNQINVDIKVRARYISNVKSSTADTTEAVETIKDLYFRVPVVENDGKYAIEDLPLLVAKPDNANIELKAVSGTTADTSIVSDIDKMLQNFFKTYCEGNDNELSYYMSDSKAAVKGLGGAVTFRAINELRVYTNENNEYLAIVNFSVEDKDSKQEIKQKLNLQIIQKENKYYIKSFDVRTSNLNIGGVQ